MTLERARELIGHKVLWRRVWISMSPPSDKPIVKYHVCTIDSVGQSLVFLLTQPLGHRGATWPEYLTELDAEHPRA